MFQTTNHYRSTKSVKHCFETVLKTMVQQIESDQDDGTPKNENRVS